MMITITTMIITMIIIPHRKWFEDKLICEEEYREEKAKVLAKLRE